MKYYRKGWAYRSKEEKPGDYFVLCMTKNKTAINLWHFTPENEYLYSFIPTEKYNRSIRWCWEKCKKLEENMRSPKPKVTVVRFAVNGVTYFSESGFGSTGCPEAPTYSIRPPEWAKTLPPEEFSEPAPFILYGVHDDSLEKEFSWRLTTDVPERQGIVPGDRVLVVAKNRYIPVTVTRIEPSEGKEQPRCRVERKLNPDAKKS